MPLSGKCVGILENGEIIHDQPFQGRRTHIVIIIQIWEAAAGGLNSEISNGKRVLVLWYVARDPFKTNNFCLMVFLKEVMTIFLIRNVIKNLQILYLTQLNPKDVRTVCLPFLSFLIALNVFGEMLLQVSVIPYVDIIWCLVVSPQKKKVIQRLIQRAEQLY